MVHVYKDYYIEADSLQYKLVEKRNSVKRQEFFCLIGYYTTLEGVYCRIIEQCGREAIQDENVQTMKQLFCLMNDTAKDIREIMAEIKEKVKEDRKAGKEEIDEEDEDEGEEELPDM